MTVPVIIRATAYSVSFDPPRENSHLVHLHLTDINNEAHVFSLSPERVVEIIRTLQRPTTGRP